MKIGLLFPGAMGESVGVTLIDNGHEVLWAGEGRGAATHARAQRFVDVGNVAALAGQVEAIFSVCPPDFAVDVARQVAAVGFAGLYVDCNAISPANARVVHDVIGAGYVDGGIIGLPPRAPGTTRLYLSGPRAAEVQALFGQGALGAVVLNDDPVAASTLKMCYAAWTKGSAALLLNVRALAEASGVGDDLQAEWDLSQPGLAASSDRAALGNAPKAWRFVGEMHEIAGTFDDFGLPTAFHEGAADVYGRLAGYKGAGDIEVAGVLETLIGNKNK